MKFQLEKGATYVADTDLSFVESFASNDKIVAMLSDYGFVDVVVKGGGRRRHVVGTWEKDDLEVELPSQLANVTRVGVDFRSSP